MAHPPDFPIIWTDGDQNHTPTAADIAKGYKTSDDYGLSKKALSNFAAEMLKQVGRDKDSGKSEHRSFVTSPPISKKSYYICSCFPHDLSPHIQFPVS